jgi:hypothetical protein
LPIERQVTQLIDHEQEEIGEHYGRLFARSESRRAWSRSRCLRRFSSTACG